MFYFLSISISIISPAASSRIHPASHSSRDENISLRHGTKRTLSRRATIGLPSRHGRALVTLNRCLTTYRKYLEKYGFQNDADVDSHEFKTKFLNFDLSFQEQLEIVMGPEIKIDRANTTRSFLWSNAVCHQMYSEIDQIILRKGTVMSNVSFIRISTSKYPDDYSWERIVLLRHELDTILVIDLAVYSYTIHRLASPYPDQCVDFPRLNFKNKYHALYNCTKRLVTPRQCLRKGWSRKVTNI